MAKLDKTQNIYIEQTRKSPMPSSLGNNHVLIMYVYDANAVLAEPLNSRSGSHILEAYTKQLEHLKNRGYKPRVH